MTKLYKYITEENSTNIEIDESEIDELIKRDCKYFLDMVGNKKVYRGMTSTPYNIGKKRLRNTNRKPSGTFYGDTFKTLNRWLVSNKHVSRNKCLITSGSLKIAKNWNENGRQPYNIYPIGKFNYTWIKAKDFNITLLDFSNWDENEWDQESFLDDLLRLKISEVTKKWNKYFTTNKGIKEAIRKGYEIWFDCKEYYYIRRRSND